MIKDGGVDREETRGGRQKKGGVEKSWTTEDWVQPDDGEMEGFKGEEAI